MISVNALLRYPVKGLTAEQVDGISIGTGETFPADRAFAVENGPSGFDPAAPAWLPKAKFLCWMKHPKLARLVSRYDDSSGVLSVESPDASASGHLGSADGRAAIETFLTAYMGEEARKPLRLLQAPGHSFSDVARKVVSFINLASVDDIARALGVHVDPARFRSNVLLDGLPAWSEATWIGKEFTVGTTRFRAVKTIPRCLATHVDPQTGTRDLDVMATIRSLRGDMDCGIYAEVIAPGTMARGDELRLAQPELGF